MKFSVLLPTKNRLDLLKLAVQTVREQDYDDWEIVVADNASSDDVRGFVASLDDPRIVFTRSEEPLAVTDNWTRCLERSTGDYVVMLGDDDGLLPGYFRRNREVIEAFKKPDLVYVQGVQYVYAGVIPGHEKSFVQVANCEFIADESAPFELSHDRALAAVKESAAFRVAFAYNMQYSLVKRAMIQRLSVGRPFFQSPYPDYYATNVLLLEASRIVVQPVPLVVVGVSPKSFGYYYFNDREGEGVSFLQNLPLPSEMSGLEATLLPGSNMNTSWLLAMETMRRNFGHRHGVALQVWRYRFLQFRHAYYRAPNMREFFAFLDVHGTAGERLMWRALHAWIRLAGLGRYRLDVRERVVDRVHCAYPKVRIFVAPVAANDLLEFSRGFSPDGFLREYLRERSSR